MNVIALGTTAYVGKDTIGQMLCEEYGYTRFAFADAVREGALAIDPMIEVPVEWCTAHNWVLTEEDAGHGHLSDIVDMYGWDEAKTIPEVRRFLQRYGTEGGRSIHGPNCWVDVLRQRIAASGVEKVVITDLRFASEAAWVHRHGICVKVNRPGFGPLDNHISENDLASADFDYQIDNNSGFDVLRSKVHDLADFAAQRQRQKPLVDPDADVELVRRMTQALQTEFGRILRPDRNAQGTWEHVATAIVHNTGLRFLPAAATSGRWSGYVLIPEDRIEEVDSGHLADKAQGVS